MTKEHEPSDPYYQHDELLGEADVLGEQRGLHLRVHLAEEPYTESQEIFTLKHHSGTRTYVHAKPYILVPDIRLTVALSPRFPYPEVASKPGA